MEKLVNKKVMWFFLLVSFVPLGVISQETKDAAVFKPEEIEQLAAPIALYPDSLVSQILMASTYPLEVVQAQRWAEQNKDITGDVLTGALEKETWDPSVKSLVNFPQVLTMMSEKLDWTQKLGDAFLAQQKDVLDAVQRLRKKAQEKGNLKTTDLMVVKSEPDVIVIESASPEVVYVPEYDPVVVYGAWPYPAYPPYYYYPPGYAAGSNLLSFGMGAACGAAWGYAWGHCDWHGGDVDVDFNQNNNYNRNIDRGKYAEQHKGRGQLDQGGRGKWQHNPENRKGVPYRDQGTAQKFNRASTSDAVKSREQFRGRADQGRQDLARGGDAQRISPRQDGGQRGTAQGGNRAGGRGDASSRPSSSRNNAFQDMDRGGRSARNSSNRGQSSRQSMSRSSGGGGRSGGGMGGGGGRGGGGRGGGGGGRGGGRR